jgi:hypothetical protein
MLNTEGVFMPQHDMGRKSINLRVVSAPAIGSVVTAPPVLMASDKTVEYTCGHCGVALLLAEEDQIHNLQIHCTKCGCYNITDD